MATTYELGEVLHPHVITEQYIEVSGEYFESPLMAFYGSQRKSISGDRFEFAYRAAQKTPAPANKRGAPARVMQPTGLESKIVVMHRAFNTLNLGVDALHMLRNPESEILQQKGREEIRRQHEDFGDAHKVFEALVCAKSFTDGEIHFNSGGQVLESSSGAEYTVDLGVPSSHKTQITGASSSYGGAIISASWATASTKILDHLDDLKIAASEINAPMPRHVWVNDSMKRNLRNNTQIKDYITGGGSPERVDRILTGSTIEDLGGYTWHFDSHTYTAADGTTKPYIPTTKAIITPDLGPWLRVRDGSELITPFEGLVGSPEEAVNQLVEIFGMFSYVEMLSNPVRLGLFMGTNFTYCFANPNAVWMPTVVF